MSVKKNSKSGTAGKKNSSQLKLFIKITRCTIVYLLAMYGLHTVLQNHLPQYREFTRKQYKNISENTVKATNQLSARPTITIRNAADLKKTPYDNLALGVPTFKCDVILDRMGYALGYSEQYEQPLWVTYKLTADEVNSKKARRSDDFRSDPDIPGKSADPEDYKRSFFDRGYGSLLQY